MPNFTLDNSFRFYSQNGRMPIIHSESIERLLQKLSSDWLRLFALQQQIQSDLMGWKKMLFNINEVLDDAMKMQATNQLVRMWLAKLPNLAYDVADLLDEFQTEPFQRPGEETSQASTSRLCDSMVRSKVKEVNDRFQDIASQMVLLGLKSTNVSRRLIPTSQVQATTVGLVDTNKCFSQSQDHRSFSGCFPLLSTVFYKVLPSDVSSQERSFGQAFVDHERNLMSGLDNCKDVLADPSGWDSVGTRPTATLVQAIVDDIVKKLESIADSMVKELASLFGSLCDRLDRLANSFWSNIEFKELYCKVKKVHDFLQNAESYRSYRYWLLCPLFTDLRNFTYDVYVLIDDKANSERQFNQAVKKIDQGLLRFLDSVKNLVARHNIKERSPIFQQPVPRIVSASYACVDDVAENKPSFNLSRSNGRFKEAIFKLAIYDDQAREKVFNEVSQVRGINSITFGTEHNKLTVTGCNLDALSIGTKLRKLCDTELVLLRSAKMTEEMGEEPKANKKQESETHEVTDQLVKTKKDSKLLASILSRMCISFK